jgi:hypothetical protein
MNFNGVYIFDDGRQASVELMNEIKSRVVLDGYVREMEKQLNERYIYENDVFKPRACHEVLKRAQAAIK